MIKSWKDIIWHQFGAAIDTLDNALEFCPESLWQALLFSERELVPEFGEFWYIAYHAIFWLDYYLSEGKASFSPPAPFTLSEFDPNGALPDNVYTKAELRDYIKYCRQKCKTRIDTLEDEFTPQACRPDWTNMTVAELLLYNMRHVQEHAAHLQLFLGQNAISGPRWVSTAKKND